MKYGTFSLIEGLADEWLSAFSVGSLRPYGCIDGKVKMAESHCPLRWIFHVDVVQILILDSICAIVMFFAREYVVISRMRRVWVTFKSKSSRALKPTYVHLKSRHLDCNLIAFLVLVLKSRLRMNILFSSTSFSTTKPTAFVIMFVITGIQPSLIIMWLFEQKSGRHSSWKVNQSM